MEYFKAYEMIKNASKICIATHLRPDGDAIGSAFSLYHMLKNMNKEVDIILPSYSKKYKYIKDMELIKNEVDITKHDLLVCVDISSVERLTITNEQFEKSKKVLVIDHHKFNSIPATLSLIDEKAPATCEIIYSFLKNNKIEITKNMADYIYMGIMTDTGSFNYERTTSKTLKIAAEMLDLGADFVTICKKLNDTIEESKAYLLSYVIENMKSYYNGKLRISYASLEIQEKYKVGTEDAEGLTNYLRAIAGTEVAIYIREIEHKKYKASIRTEGNVDCSIIAANFGGGGHIRASGFEFTDYDRVLKELIDVVGEYIDGENNRNT